MVSVSSDIYSFNHSLFELSFFSKEEGFVWVFLSHKTSLTPPIVIEVPVPSQESERSFICMLGV